MLKDMSNYDTIAGLDRARYEALLNAEILHPLPQNAVLVIGADWCPDTQNSVMRNGYATRTSDGRPIVYLNDANPETHKILGTLAGKEILGGGVDSALPPSRPTREYNYPTVVTTRDGVLTEVIYADTVPPGKLTDPAAMRSDWQGILAAKEKLPERPVYNEVSAAPLFANPIGESFAPNTVYAVVSSNCGHCHELLARSNYPQTTDDGRPIVYLNMALMKDENGNPKNLETYLKAQSLYLAAKSSGVDIEGYPTFITTDAHAKPALAAAGPDDIIKQFFPNVLAKEMANPQLAPLPVQDSAPPVPVQDSAPPPGFANALGALGVTATEQHVAHGPARTPVDGVNVSSVARNA